MVADVLGECVACVFRVKSTKNDSNFLGPLDPQNEVGTFLRNVGDSSTQRMQCHIPEDTSSQVLTCL